MRSDFTAVQSTCGPPEPSMGDAVGPPGAVDAQMFPILDKGCIADADVLPGRLLRCSPPGQACKGKEWCKDVLVAVTQLTCRWILPLRAVAPKFLINRLVTIPGLSRAPLPPTRANKI